MVSLSASRGLANHHSPLDTARHQDPSLEAAEELKPVARFDPRLKALWLEALARPEADLKRQAADAIARAHALGMPGLGDTAPPLLAAMEAPDAHRFVRLAAARALVALDARQAAPALMARARADGLETARLLEPVLARWDHAPMRPVWLARLDDPRTNRGLLILAVQAMAVVKVADAAPGLRRLALAPGQAGDVRLEAARALGMLQPAGLEADAGLLAADASPGKVLDRLIAASLLAHHNGPATEALLLQLANDREPTIATLAARRLVEIAPTTLQPVLPGMASSGDAGLRLLAARALAELRTPDAVGQLGALLDDPHRDVRVLAREALVRLAGAEPLAEPVREAVLRVLGSGGPRGLEQGAITVGTLRYESAAQRLVQLLQHEDPEVRVSTAWALRRLAVPATAAAILERAQIDTEKPPTPPVRIALPTAEGADPVVDHLSHLEHLIEALGVLRYRPAIPFLSRFLPMPPLPRPPGDNPLWRSELRATAVWSLGQIGEALPPADVVATLRKRLSGEPIGDMVKRDDEAAVRAQAAVSLGRMKVKESTPELRQIYQDERELPGVRRACAWAVERITGELVPALKLPVKPREVWHGGWFLEPDGGTP